MEQTISGTVYAIEGIQALSVGFKQVVTLLQPEIERDGRVLYKEEYFQIQIWSKEQTDKRFLSFNDKHTERKAVCYLKGERWMSKHSNEFAYALKLNLKNWI